MRHRIALAPLAVPVMVALTLSACSTPDPTPTDTGGAGGGLVATKSVTATADSSSGSGGSGGTTQTVPDSAVTDPPTPAPSASGSPRGLDFTPEQVLKTNDPARIADAFIQTYLSPDAAYDANMMPAHQRAAAYATGTFKDTLLHDIPAQLDPTVSELIEQDKGFVVTTIGRGIADDTDPNDPSARYFTYITTSTPKNTAGWVGTPTPGAYLVTVTKAAEGWRVSSSVSTYRG